MRDYLYVNNRTSTTETRRGTETGEKLSRRTQKGTKRTLPLPRLSLLRPLRYLRENSQGFLRASVPLRASVVNGRQRLLRASALAVATSSLKPLTSADCEVDTDSCSVRRSSADQRSAFAGASRRSR